MRNVEVVCDKCKQPTTDYSIIEATRGGLRGKMTPRELGYRPDCCDNILVCDRDHEPTAAEREVQGNPMALGC